MYIYIYNDIEYKHTTIFKMPGTPGPLTVDLYLARLTSCVMLQLWMLGFIFWFENSIINNQCGNNSKSQLVRLRLEEYLYSIT